MKKSILITGVAGSGKSSVFRELKKQGCNSFDIECMEGLFCMRDKKTGKKYENYDNDEIDSVKEAEWICDEKKLKKLIEENSDKTTFYCGVASNTLDLLRFFDKIILLSITPETLRKRLSTRKSGEFGNTPESQDHVLSWKDWWENQMCKKGAIEINANANVQEVASEILKNLK